METIERKLANVKEVEPKRDVEVSEIFGGLAILRFNEDAPKQGLKKGVYVGVGSTIIDGPYTDKRVELMEIIDELGARDEEDVKAAETMLKVRCEEEDREERVITGEEQIIERLNTEPEYQMYISITGATNNVMQILKEERRLNEKEHGEDNTGMDRKNSDADTVLHGGGSDDLREFVLE